MIISFFCNTFSITKIFLVDVLCFFVCEKYCKGLLCAPLNIIYKNGD